MNKILRMTLYQSKGTETTVKILGVLAAISVVSKCTEQASLLELRTAERESVKPNGKAVAISVGAN